MSVCLSEAADRRWIETAEVGIEADRAIGNGVPLKILIEKDFACVNPGQSKDDSDAFLILEPLSSADFSV